VAYTTTEFIADVKLRAFLPTSQATFASADILLLADAETQTSVIPLVQSIRNEYWVRYYDHTITAAQANYDIPVRAIGMALRDVQLVASSGQVTSLPQISLEDIQTTTSGEPEAFYLRQNQVYLYPTPISTTGTLRLYYELRPGQLVLTTAAGLISSINTGTNAVTVASIPSAWTASYTYDLIRQDGASEPLAIDQAVSSVASTTLTFSSTLPTSPALRVSDYVALAGQTPIPQIPAELRPVLAQATAVRMMESMMLPGVDFARRTLDKEIETAVKLLSPRVSGEVKKIRATHGWL
jgi:hypothetical protein